MDLIKITCTTCSGVGYAIEHRDGGIYHLTCETCRGVGFKLHYSESGLNHDYGREDRTSE